MILTADQIREWDQYTISHEPISSANLMERAASACYDWLMNNGYQSAKFSVFCGKGNNGGDGLVIARMLSLSGHDVKVYILEFGHKGTEDFQLNLERLHDTDATIKFIPSEESIPHIQSDQIIIDALLGSGLNRPVEGLTASLIKAINTSGNQIIAIDVPSGLSTDYSSRGNIVISAAHTLSFQCYKPCFMMPENEAAIGTIHILDIGLLPAYLTAIKPQAIFLQQDGVKKIFRKRKSFSHKGSFGHALLIAGSHGKMGAAVLAARSCLRTGVGLCTIHIPVCGYEIMQSSVPEAMVLTDPEENFNSSFPENISRYSVVGLGPGLGTKAATAAMAGNLFKEYSNPMVLDADALNILSENKELLASVPPYSIITPHPKEFERLFGVSQNDFERVKLASAKAREHQLIIVLKGHRSFIATPGGQNYFNSTGNAGMATGGTGDVLTGIITALVAQGYEPEQAAVLGVFIHGKAGDHAAKALSMQSLIASDIIKFLGKAFLEFE
jgi:hydroxyethylthiazole kinase-like uncharacterized protein yjeF